MGKRFAPDLLPDPVRFFEAEGLPLVGRGEWRTTACPFHGGSDSLRANVYDGRWRCMACHVGGDLIDFVRQRYGMPFMQAAEFLEAVRDDGKPTRPRRETTLSPGASMKQAAQEMRIGLVVMADVRRGLVPNETDWARYIACTRAVELLCEEFA